MLPENAVRNLRQVAGILRGIDLWDEDVVRELIQTSRRLEMLADRVEGKVVDLAGHPLMVVPPGGR
jgi:hypothetical protein